MIFPTATLTREFHLTIGVDNPKPTDEKQIDEVYHDRNLLAIAFARAIRLTWSPDTAGWYWHDG